jgi:hypothetical protein
MFCFAVVPTHSSTNHNAFHITAHATVHIPAPQALHANQPNQANIFHNLLGFT